MLRLSFLFGFFASLFAGLADGASPYGLAARPAFTAYNNGLLPDGAPAVASDWSTVVAYPNLSFQNILGVLPIPGTGKLILWEREGHVYSFDDDPATSAKTLVLDLSNQCQGWDDSGLLGLTFHPNFANNHYVYLWYNWVPPGTVQGDPVTRPNNRISTHQRLARYTYVPATGLLDPASEYIILDQTDHNLWHNGGGLFFRPSDGFLYLTNGNDANDGNDQIIDYGLFGVLIRIDVDKRGGDISQPPTKRAHEEVGPNWPNAYYLPKTNPFLNNPIALGEIYGLGLRSPHRATVDPVTDRIYIGDVGASTYEELNIIEPSDPPGLNFQWHVIEGLHGDLTPPYFGVNKRPVLDYDHGQGTAIIGGYVYRGSQFPELAGKYIFGDNYNNLIWYLDESTPTGDSPAAKVPLATVPKGPGPNSGGDYTGLSSFGYDTHGELLMCQMSSVSAQLYKLSRGGTQAAQMPATLSATGLFSNVATLTATTGLLSYDVNTPLWSDGAKKQRWLAVPDSQTIGYAPTGEWTFPNGSLFVKHFELPIDDRNPSRVKRLETRVLVRDSTGYVYGGSYKWRADNSDADLVVDAMTENVTIATASGDLRTQPWFYPGRQDCLSCHTRASGGVLGLNTPQDHRSHLFTETGNTDNQLRAWNHVGYFNPPIDEASLATLQKFSAIDDTSASLEQRARSYLDANCAHCHRPGGVPAFWDARIETPLASANIIDGQVQSTLGTDGARVVVPKDLTRSILYKRLNTATENYKMPPIAKNVMDTKAVAVIAQWIDGLAKPVVPSLQSPWQQADIGTLATPGGATSTDPHTFTLHSTGEDISSTSDNFHYVYRSLTGDGLIVARVTAIGNSNPWAKAGVMIRETLDAGSANAVTVLTPSNGIAFQSRNATGIDTIGTVVPGSAPSWVALRRSGNTFIGARSSDGVTWEEIGRQTFTMAATVKIGLCLTANDPTVESAASFESVSFEPGAPFIITSQPLGLLAKAGGPVSLSVATYGDPPSSYQWRRNGVAIRGAVSNHYDIPIVSANQGGSYTVLLNGKVASAAANLAVVGDAVFNANVVGGGTAALDIPASGAGITYRWAKDGVPLTSGSASKATLIVPTFNAARVGGYSCTVKAGAASMNLGPYELHLLVKPQLVSTAPAAGFVGGAFTWQLAASQPATTYTVTGLPAGLIFDHKTGLITGQARESGSFTVTVTPSNAAGTGQTERYPMNIDPLPAGLAGGYGGLVDPSVPVNDGLGGRFSFRVTSSGMVTGKLYQGGAAVPLPFAGQILATASGSATASFKVQRGTLHPLTLSASIANGGVSLTGGLALDGQSASLAGRHYMDAAGAAPLAVAYNAVLPPPTVSAGDPPAPLGAGRLRVVLSPTGTATISGLTADGAAISFGTNLNNDATLPLLQGLYAGRGSLAGSATIATVNGQRAITNPLSWRKLATSNSRIYPAGFTVAVPMAGREFHPPAAGQIFLGLPNETGNARVDFTGAGLEAAAQAASVSQTFTLTPDSVAAFATGAANPCKVALAINPNSGVFSGTFVLRDKTLARPVAFSGLFVPGNPSAFGCFRLPQLPAHPQPATTPLTTPVLSGLVQLHAAP